jgi:hypothetical protein
MGHSMKLFAHFNVAEVEATQTILNVCSELVDYDDILKDKRCVPFVEASIVTRFEVSVWNGFAAEET